MQDERKSFYYYRDIVFCLDEINGLLVRHIQANWFVDVIYVNGSTMSYECIHKDEAQSLFGALRQMLDAKLIEIEDKF